MRAAAGRQRNDAEKMKSERLVWRGSDSGEGRVFFSAYISDSDDL